MDSGTGTGMEREIELGHGFARIYTVQDLHDGVILRGK
jgi:hypothetical protein